MIGYVIEAMKRDKRINRAIGLPDNETPYAVIALGYPDEKFEKVAGRKGVILRYADIA